MDTQQKAPRAPEVRGTRYLAIDLDPQGLFVVSGAAGQGAARVEHAFSWLPGSDRGPPLLTAETAKELGEQLRDRLRSAGVPLGPALVAIGRDKIILKELKYPPVAPDEEPAVVRFQAMKEIGENADDVVLDYSPLEDAGADPSAERRALAVVVKKDVYAAVQAMCVAAGLKLVAVTPRPFAVAAGLAQAFASRAAQALASPADAAAVVTLSPQGGEFTVIHQGRVAFTRTIPSQVLGNETLLLGEIKRNLTTFDGQNQTRAIKAVYVPEGENLLGGWADRIEDGLAIPVRTYDPVASAAEDVPLKLRGRFAGAAGLLAGQSVGLPINFASPRQPRAKADPRRKLLLVAGLAAVLLILVGGIGGYLVLAAADSKLANKQALKAQLEKEIADAESDHKRLEAAVQWEARGVNYLDELYELSDRLPPGDVLRVNKITGAAIRVDKTGKQEGGQAKLELFVGTKNPDAAAKLVSAIDNDNTKERKYYLGTKKTVGGTDAHTNVYNQLATIETRVMYRSPNEYTRYPMFSPPRRGVILPSTPPPAEATAPPAESKPKEVEPDDK